MMNALRKARAELLSSVRDRTLLAESRGRVSELSEERAAILVALEGLQRKAKATAERVSDLRRYRAELADELDRMTRAEGAGAVLADLKITHSPACDQPVTPVDAAADQCFLCHQHITDESLAEELGAVRSGGCDRSADPVYHHLHLVEIARRRLGNSVDVIELGVNQLCEPEAVAMAG